MIDNTAKYLYAVYKLKSVSLAAKELYISQPALSAAIKKAEEALGAPIFNRKTLPFSLTPEGKIYMESVEKMLLLAQETAQRIRDIQQVRGGTLRIGTSTHLSFYVIPKILKVFHSAYPHVDINITVTDTDELYDLLKKETADLIFLPATTPRESFEAVTLFEERFVVAMPANTPNCAHLQPYALTYEQLLSGEDQRVVSDLSAFHDIEFIYTPPNTEISKKRKLLLGKYDIPPYITSNAGRQQLNYNLMRAGFGALLTTDSNIATMPPDANCVYYVLGSQAAKQYFCIVYPTFAEGSQMRIAQTFIDTAKSLFSCDAPLTQLVDM